MCELQVKIDAAKTNRKWRRDKDIEKYTAPKY